MINRDSLSYRIESIRKFIEESLGIEIFLEVYRFATEGAENLSDDQISSEIQKNFKKF